MVLLKKDILIECSADSRSDYLESNKFIMIYFKPELLKAFVKLAQLSVLPPRFPPAVTVESVDTGLLKFIDSLEPYFLDREEIDECLTKIKLFELLFNLVQADSSIFSQLMDLRAHRDNHNSGGQPDEPHVIDTACRSFRAKLQTSNKKDRNNPKNRQSNPSS
jgi:hypothetical protein